MFSVTVAVPHGPGDRLRDTTALSRKHDRLVRGFIDGFDLFFVAEIDWGRDFDHTRAVCWVTDPPPEVKR